MRFLTALFVIAPLLAIGALPAAGQSNGPGIGARPPVMSSARADRENYIRRVRDDMREWQQKLHDYSERSKARGRNAGSRADRQLDQTWVKLDAASQKLQNTGPRGWRAAKASYEQSSRELDKAWARARRQDR